MEMALDQSFLDGVFEDDCVNIEATLIEGRQTSFAAEDQIPHHHVFGRVHLVSSHRTPNNPSFKYFAVDGVLTYVGFCNDFGPMSLGTVFQFCEFLDDVMKQYSHHSLAMQAQPESEAVTNSVFLLGSYMIMKLGLDVETVQSSFQALRPNIISYRDVSPGEQNFHLFVKDCWAGLHKAKSLGWVDFGPNGFHLREYLDLDSPLNADLHEIVPGKFIAMRGPKDLPGGALWRDVVDEDGSFLHRDFSPDHFSPILQEFDVQVVVRLNSPEYDATAFRRAGIAVADLQFPDCTNPPVDVAAKFVTMAESVPGVLAVHCRAGLGRTGTLIALYMMKHFAFSAREAMGWLRIVRPGSVIGAQQDFLCRKEPLMRRAANKFRRDGGRSPMRPAGAGAAPVQRLVDDIAAQIDARVRAAMTTHPAPAAGPAAAYTATATEAAEQDEVVAAAEAAAAAALAEHVAAAAERRRRQLSRPGP